MENEELSFPEVDYQKSIAKKRVVYKRSRSVVFEYAMFYFLPISLIIINSVACYYSALDGNYFVSAFCVLIFLASLFSIILFGKLFKVSGGTILQNKEDAINCIAEFYKDCNFNISRENILRDYHRGSGLRGGRVITIIFNNDEVYFHKMSLGRGDTMMAFYPLFDYFKTKEIAEYFQYLQFKRKKEELAVKSQ
jgi:hypothetical protein